MFVAYNNYYSTVELFTPVKTSAKSTFFIIDSTVSAFMHRLNSLLNLIVVFCCYDNLA